MAGYGSLGVQGLTYQLLDVMYPLIDQARMLVQKYDVVVTNPPYMGSSGMNAKLSDYVKKYYPDTKSDMSTVCMERTINMCNEHGYMAMINIPVWMFLSSYEKLREKILRENTIVSMVHPGRGIFGSDFGTTSFVIAKAHLQGYKGHYRRLFDKQGEVESVEQREQRFFEKRGVFYATQDNFSKIPGSPVAYWVTDNMFSIFEKSKTLAEIAKPRQGLATSDNDRFLKFWNEVEFSKIGFDITSISDENKFLYKWFPCTKGGSFRRWYGNNDYVVNWENDGQEIKAYAAKLYKSYTRTIKNIPFYFRKGLTWSTISAGLFSLRYVPTGFVFETKGAMCYIEDKYLYYVLALYNTKVMQQFLAIVSPTLDYHEGPLGRTPIVLKEDRGIEKTAKENIELSKIDWDSFETSWDFKRHPLV